MPSSREFSLIFNSLYLFFLYWNKLIYSVGFRYAAREILETEKAQMLSKTNGGMSKEHRRKTNLKIKASLIMTIRQCKTLTI